jgi:secondary thiamine-phosphate synthase enzyme
METLARSSTCHHAVIRLTTHKPTEFIDLTERLQALVAEHDLRFGIVNVQTLHTTTAVIVNEAEPGLLADFEALLERMAPDTVRYEHDDLAVRTVNLTEAERPNGHAHCRALLLSSSACLNVFGGRLLFGRWQRVFFVELDGPRERSLSVLVLGEAGR